MLINKEELRSIAYKRFCIFSSSSSILPFIRGCPLLVFFARILYFRFFSFCACIFFASLSALRSFCSRIRSSRRCSACENRLFPPLSSPFFLFAGLFLKFDFDLSLTPLAGLLFALLLLSDEAVLPLLCFISISVLASTTTTSVSNVFVLTFPITLFADVNRAGGCACSCLSSL